MRKLFSLMLVVLGAAALVSCSKDDDDVLRDGEGVITFVTKAKRIEVKKDSYYEPEEDLYLETFNAGDRITIDWGDGNEDEYVPVREEYKDEDGEIEVSYDIAAEHTYTDGKSSHTVTVKGKIKYFNVFCEVTSIDATKCPALEELYCEENPLTSLYVSRCTALKELHCSDNQLTSLDVSGCTALKKLHCYGTQLTSLDVSKNTALERLNCHDNQLTSLDVSKNTALEWLACDNTQLTSLDVSKNTALEFLSCDDNQLTSLDVSKNTALEFLSCYGNQLTSLDVSKNTALHRLECYGNQFSASAMNKIYNDLPVVNNGDLRCDKLGDYSIARNKGWYVIF